MARIEVRSRSIFLPPMGDDLSADQRLRPFIERQTTILEEVAPLRRVALAVEHADPLVAGVMKCVRANTVKEIERTVHPALGGLAAREKRNLLLALHMICAWSSWGTLRSHHGLGRAAARALMSRAALAILNSALRDAGAVPSSPAAAKKECTESALLLLTFNRVRVYVCF